MENEINERIDRYLNNELPDKERQDFEKECKTNAELAYKLKQRLKYRHAVLVKGRSKYKTLYDSDSIDAGEKTITKTLEYRRSWRVAAVIALLIVSGITLYQTLKPAPGMQEIYLSYIDELPSPGVRSDFDMGLTEMGKSWNRFVEAYQEENWKDGITQLNQLLADQKFQDRNQAYLYLGISYLKTDQEQKALNNFQKITENNQSLYYQSRWYMVLTYLKLEKKEKALQLLKLLENSKSYGSRVQEIRSALEG